MGQASSRLSAACPPLGAVAGALPSVATLGCQRSPGMTRSADAALPTGVPSKLKAGGVPAPRAALPSSRAAAASAATPEPTPDLGPFKKALTKADLRPGDILLLLHEQSNTCPIYKAIDWVQWMAGAVCDTGQGESRTIHAAIWTKSPDNPGNTSPRGPGEPEIVEASGSLGRVHGTALRAGLYKVIRPTNGALGDWAAQAAMGIGESRRVAYNHASAAVAGLRNSGFGAAGQRNASRFEAELLSETPKIAKLFCTETVLGSYQGTAPRLGVELKGALALDAQRTSPRKMEHALIGDQAFEAAGHIRVLPEEVLYEEFPPGRDRFHSAQAAKAEIEAAESAAPGASEVLAVALLAHELKLPLHRCARQLLGCTSEHLQAPLAELTKRGLLSGGKIRPERHLVDGLKQLMDPDKLERAEATLRQRNER